MAATFDLYTKRTRFFYITRGIIVIALITGLAGWITNVGLPNIVMGFADAILLVGGLTVPVFLLYTVSGWFITYIKDGELILGDDFLEIDSVKVPIDGASLIKLRVSYWNRRRAGNIVTNSVEAKDKNGAIYKRRFVIKTIGDSVFIDQIADEWQKKGYAVDVRYHSSL